jgi:hypothetical protein
MHTRLLHDITLFSLTLVDNNYPGILRIQVEEWALEMVVGTDNCSALLRYATLIATIIIYRYMPGERRG